MANQTQNNLPPAWLSAQETAENVEMQGIYLHAGLALYLAQCLEHEIVNSLGLTAIIQIWRTSKPKSIDEWEVRVDQIWGENYERTLGKLLQRLRVSGITIPDTLDSDLRDSLKSRNNLVHHYFRVRAKDWFDAEGRRSMADELVAMQGLFQKTDQTLHDLASSMSHSIGVTEETVNLITELMMSHATQEEVDQAISAAFGRGK